MGGSSGSGLKKTSAASDYPIATDASLESRARASESAVAEPPLAISTSSNAVVSSHAFTMQAASLRPWMRLKYGLSTF